MRKVAILLIVTNKISRKYMMWLCEKRILRQTVVYAGVYIGVSGHVANVLIA